MVDVTHFLRCSTHPSQYTHIWHLHLPNMILFKCLTLRFATHKQRHCTKYCSFWPHNILVIRPKVLVELTYGHFCIIQCYHILVLLLITEVALHIFTDLAKQWKFTFAARFYIQMNIGIIELPAFCVYFCESPFLHHSTFFLLAL